jgi:hypothetical protein
LEQAMSEPAESENLTPPDAAAHLKRTEKTLAQWRSQGRGPAYLKTGGRILYRRSDLDAWLDSCRRTSTAQKAS